MTCRLRQLPAATAVLVTAVAMMLLVTSCGDADDGDSASPDEVLIPSHEVEQVLQDAGPGEREFLEDGRLTFAEYEQAFFNVVACIEAYDITVDRRLLKWREYTFLASSPTGGVGAVVANCAAEFFSETQRLWGRIAYPTAADLQEGYDWLANCLREAGVDDVPEHPSGNELIAISERFHGVSDTFGDCAWEMYQRFGHPLFGSAE